MVTRVAQLRHSRRYAHHRKYFICGETTTFELGRLQDCIANGAAETPMAVLGDCYSDEYTAYTIKNLNSRSADLQGQVARVAAEAQLAREKAGAFRDKVDRIHDQIEQMERRLKRVRDEKDAVAEQMESTASDVDSAREELKNIKLENSTIVRSQ
eukprot:jgi/Ulvmu1/6289/UM281_0002.1